MFMERKQLYGVMMVWMAACAFFSCSDNGGSLPHRTVNVAFLYDGDTLYLPSDESVGLVACYGSSTKEFQSVLQWESSDVTVFAVHADQRYMKGDSCLSSATLSPKQNEGAARVTFSVIPPDGKSRTLSLNVVNTGIKATHLEGLPEGSFAEVVNKIKFNMVYVAADTLIDVGPRVGVDIFFDSTGHNYSTKQYEKAYEKWKRTYVTPYYDGSVYVASFYIGQTEVTTELWMSVMGKDPNKSTIPYLQAPVSWVYWYECQEFVARLQQLTGRPYRLLSNAEWEYAARGGNQSRGYVYAGGNVFGEVGWTTSGYGMPYDVGQKKPNELGLYDMSGNAIEWVQDSWGDSVSAEVYENMYEDEEGHIAYRDTLVVKDFVTYRKARGTTSIIRAYINTILLIGEQQRGEASGYIYIPRKRENVGFRLGLSATEAKRP